MHSGAQEVGCRLPRSAGRKGSTKLPVGPVLLILEVAFSRAALGEDDLVLVEFDVPPGDTVGRLGLNERAAVDEALGTNERANQAEGVTGRDSEIAARLAIGEGIRLDADRQR